VNRHVIVQSIQDMAKERIRIDLANQELYLAQIIKMNPSINLLNYTLCKMPCYEQDGKYYEKTWLEKIKQ
jgi:hypothetical protein